MLFLYGFFGKQAFGAPCKILDKLEVIFEVCRLPLRIDSVARGYGRSARPTLSASFRVRRA